MITPRYGYTPTHDCAPYHTKHTLGLDSTECSILEVLCDGLRDDPSMYTYILIRYNCNVTMAP